MTEITAAPTEARDGELQVEQQGGQNIITRSVTGALKKLQEKCNSSQSAQSTSADNLNDVASKKGKMAKAKPESDLVGSSATNGRSVLIKDQSWSVKHKELFFEALMQHGKNFPALTAFINLRLGKRSGRRPVKIEQVRWFYYRAWRRVASFLKVEDNVDKHAVELFGLINFGEVRKKFSVGLKGSMAESFADLVTTGSATFKLNARRSVRIKTPPCAALRSLIYPDTHTDVKAPDIVQVILRPGSHEAWCFVQAAAQNPMLRLSAPRSMKLDQLLGVLQQKWGIMEPNSLNVNLKLPKDGRLKAAPSGDGNEQVPLDVPLAPICLRSFVEMRAAADAAKGGAVVGEPKIGGDELATAAVEWSQDAFLHCTLGQIYQCVGVREPIVFHYHVRCCGNESHSLLKKLLLVAKAELAELNKPKKRRASVSRSPQKAPATAALAVSAVSTATANGVAATTASAVSAVKVQPMATASTRHVSVVASKPTVSVGGIQVSNGAAAAIKIETYAVPSRPSPNDTATACNVNLTDIGEAHFKMPTKQKSVNPPKKRTILPKTWKDVPIHYLGSTVNPNIRVNGPANILTSVFPDDAFARRRANSKPGGSTTPIVVRGGRTLDGVQYELTGGARARLAGGSISVTVRSELPAASAAPDSPYYVAAQLLPNDQLLLPDDSTPSSDFFSPHTPAAADSLPPTRAGVRSLAAPNILDIAMAEIGTPVKNDTDYYMHYLNDTDSVHNASDAATLASWTASVRAVANGDASHCRMDLSPVASLPQRLADDTLPTPCASPPPHLLGDSFIGLSQFDDSMDKYLLGTPINMRDAREEPSSDPCMEMSESAVCNSARATGFTGLIPRRSNVGMETESELGNGVGSAAEVDPFGLMDGGRAAPVGRTHSPGPLGLGDAFPLNGHLFHAEHSKDSLGAYVSSAMQLLGADNSVDCAATFGELLRAESIEALALKADQ